MKKTQTARSLPHGRWKILNISGRLINVASLDSTCNSTVYSDKSLKDLAVGDCFELVGIKYIGHNPVAKIEPILVDTSGKTIAQNGIIKTSMPYEVDGYTLCKLGTILSSMECSSGKCVIERGAHYKVYQ